MEPQTGETIGELISRGRRAMESSQRDFADLVGVKSPTISRWERGDDFPGGEYIAALTKVLQLPGDWPNKVRWEKASVQRGETPTGVNIPEDVLRSITELHRRTGGGASPAWRGFMQMLDGALQLAENRDTTAHGTDPGDRHDSSAHAGDQPSRPYLGRRRGRPRIISGG